MEQQEISYKNKVTGEIVEVLDAFRRRSMVVLKLSNNHTIFIEHFWLLYDQVI